MRRRSRRSRRRRRRRSETVSLRGVRSAFFKADEGVSVCLCLRMRSASALSGLLGTERKGGRPADRPTDRPTDPYRVRTGTYRGLSIYRRAPRPAVELPPWKEGKKEGSRARPTDRPSVARLGSILTHLQRNVTCARAQSAQETAATSASAAAGRSGGQGRAGKGREGQGVVSHS